MDKNLHKNRTLMVFDPTGTMTDLKLIATDFSKETWSKELQRRARNWGGAAGKYIGIIYEDNRLIDIETYPTGRINPPALPMEFELRAMSRFE